MSPVRSLHFALAGAFLFCLLAVMLAPVSAAPTVTISPSVPVIMPGQHVTVMIRNLTDGSRFVSTIDVQATTTPGSPFRYGLNHVAVPFDLKKGVLSVQLSNVLSGRACQVTITKGDVTVTRKKAAKQEKWNTKFTGSPITRGVYSAAVSGTAATGTVQMSYTISGRKIGPKNSSMVFRPALRPFGIVQVSVWVDGTLIRQQRIIVF